MFYVGLAVGFGIDHLMDLIPDESLAAHPFSPLVLASRSSNQSSFLAPVELFCTCFFTSLLSAIHQLYSDTRAHTHTHTHNFNLFCK